MKGYNADRCQLWMDDVPDDEAPKRHRRDDEGTNIDPTYMPVWLAPPRIAPIPKDTFPTLFTDEELT